VPGRLRGIGVWPGRVAGPVLVMAAPPALPPEVPGADPERELGRVDRALAAVDADLRARAEVARSPDGGDILLALAELIRDPALRADIGAQIGQGRDAPHAVAAAFGLHRDAFAAAGGFLAERAADLDDLMNRAVAVLLDQPMPGIPAPGHPFILVATDLAPADTVDLDPAMVLALVTERGGPTSHTAVLARALGLPAVVACAGACAAEGTAIVDGTTGEVSFGLEADLDTDAGRGSGTAAADRAGPVSSGGGAMVPLLVNIGSADDLDGEAEGIGLFRTEFLFLGRATEPRVEEQVEAYARVFAAMPGKPVLVRTLDAGADKPLLFMQRTEPNPALGVRGLRAARRHPLILANQLQAIAQAAQDTKAEVRVMAPMVATVAEAAGFAAQCRALGLRTVGVMVEIPAAALRASRLLTVADFLSIGTNDLAQYTLAADRQCGDDLPDLLDPWQPAVLQLVAACAEAGAAAGKPVGVCGEAAADPLLAPVLVGLGVTSLSMSPRAVSAVRTALARRSPAECRDLAARVLAVDDPAEARSLALT